MAVEVTDEAAIIGLAIIFAPAGLAVAEIRRAIRDGDLALAGTLLDDRNNDFPDMAESPALEAATKPKCMPLPVAAFLASKGS